MRIIIFMNKVKDMRLPPPPIFGTADGAPGEAMSLDDIFDEFLMAEDQAFLGNYAAADKTSVESGGSSTGGNDKGDRDGYEDSNDEDEDDGGEEGGNGKKRSRGAHRSMTEQQKVERR